MNSKILSGIFFKRNTLQVAQDLLGCFLVRRTGKKLIKGVITETEAYVGEEDLACHASRGRTPRTEIMYGRAGHAYVYMIYGMYHCLNIVTEQKNFPAAVLIRSVSPSVTFRAKDYRRNNSNCAAKRDKDVLLNGPGKVCRYFKIDKKLNGWDLTRAPKQSLVRGFAKTGGLWIEKGIIINKKDIKKSKRIGIDYAKHCRHYLWNFSTNYE